MKDKSMKVKLTRKEIICLWSLIPYLTLKFSNEDELRTVYQLDYERISRSITKLQEMILNSEFSDENKEARDITVELADKDLDLFFLIDPGNYEDKGKYNLDQASVEEIFDSIRSKYRSLAT